MVKLALISFNPRRPGASKSTSRVAASGSRPFDVGQNSSATKVRMGSSIRKRW